MRLEPNVTCIWASLEHRRSDDYVDDGTEGIIAYGKAGHVKVLVV
jgi:hypothetical protein